MKSEFDILREGWPGFAPQFDVGGEVWCAYTAGFRGVANPEPELYLAYKAGQAWKKEYESRKPKP